MVCLQEVHLHDDSEASAWFSSSGYNYLVSSGSVKSAGVVILHRLSTIVRGHWQDDSGRFILAELQIADSIFRVVSASATNRNPTRNLFLEDISSALDPSFPTLVGGDFQHRF